MQNDRSTRDAARICGPTGLRERARAVDGLRPGERSWIAASATADWQERAGSEAQGESGDAVDALEEVSRSHASALSRAGVDTSRDLVDADLGRVAETTGLDVKLLRHWRALARARLE